MSGYLIWYITVIFLFPLILMSINAILDHQRIKNQKDDPDDKGISGFRRATIALTLIIIIGISLFHLIVVKTEVNVSSEMVGNILSMLTGVVASIAGFYFGGKGALDTSSGKPSEGISDDDAARNRKKRR
ncbi:MAG TPA: hypothetical protein PKZ42_06175 [Syntrophales bacterium]|nr:hypothetical protein [Syntrophales bacterium]